MSDLVGNPEDRFSGVAAHIKLCDLGKLCFSFKKKVKVNND